MKKKLLIILLSLVTPALQAAGLYVDFSYRDALSSLPEQRSWFKRLFSDEQRKVFLVASLSKRNGGDGQDILLVPPTILESFERSDNELKRSKSENLNLLSSQFVNEVEQLVLKVEFFSIKKQQANAFIESLKSLSAAYIAASASPAASKLATSAMDAIQAVLSDNRSLYLTYWGGLKLDESNAQLSLYFDNAGNINDRVFDDADASHRVVFQLGVKSEFVVDFNYSFLNQGVNLVERNAYAQLDQAKSSSDKRNACGALRSRLKQRFSSKIANDLVAIAINDIEWPQDETKYSCIKGDEAVRYKREHGLKNIANCTSSECSKTKSVLFLMEGKSSSRVLREVSGSEEFESNCLQSTQFTRLYRWSNIRSIHVDDSFKSFGVKSCLNTAEGNLPYDHKFSWLNGRLVTHSCDLSVQGNNCD